MTAGNLAADGFVIIVGTTVFLSIQARRRQHKSPPSVIVSVVHCRITITSYVAYANVIGGSHITWPTGPPNQERFITIIDQPVITLTVTCLTTLDRSFAIQKMTMTSSPITLYGQRRRRHLVGQVGQQIASDFDVPRNCWSICSLYCESNNTSMLYLGRLFCFTYPT